MEADIKINADLTKSIELLCDKLGLAATEIIPHYTKIYIASAVGAIIRGVLSIILPFCLFLIKVPINSELDEYSLFPTLESAQAFWLLLKVATCFIFVAVGIWVITINLDELFAAKGKAINELINQIRGE